ncbi:hypothetical protein QW180_31570 [Vibrio sinaloensis]|nr:hypothetical protein [Vibrio sinaloensis]
MKGAMIWQSILFAILILPCQLGVAEAYKALNQISYDNLVLSSVVASVGGVLLAFLTSFFRCVCVFKIKQFKKQLLELESKSEGRGDGSKK